jgi:hypothetical protein
VRILRENGLRELREERKEAKEGHAARDLQGLLGQTVCAKEVQVRIEKAISSTFPYP